MGTTKGGPPDEDGCYWIRSQYGTISIQKWTEGDWHCLGPHDEVEILEGPLEPPDEHDLARQPAHYARELALEIKRSQPYDPVWNEVIDGYYWVIRPKGTDPEVAVLFEGTWNIWTDYEEQWWSAEEGQPGPTILYGPIPRPTVRRFHS